MGPARELDVRLLRLVADPDSPRLLERLRRLARDGAAAPHAAFARKLLGLEVPEPEAEALLVRIGEHRARVGERLGRDPGFVWAALDRIGGGSELLENPGWYDASAASDEPPDSGGEAERAERGTVDRAIAAEVARFRRSGTSAGLLAVGVDGPDPGSRVLGRVVRTARSTLRDSDVVGRVEPGVIHAVLPRASRVIASAAAERVRRTVERRSPAAAGDRARSITVSVGISVVPDDGDAVDGWTAAARAALDRAREEGGNRVVAHAGERRVALRLPPTAGAATADLRAAGVVSPVRLIDVSADGFALVELSTECRHEIVDLHLGPARSHRARGRIVRSDPETGRAAVALAEPLPRAVLDELVGAFDRGARPKRADG